MLEFFERLQRVSLTDSSVLLRGETGTGKELVAKAIHMLSPRSSRPFHALNCASLTSELMASELFGHMRGAFTGAVSEHKGLFEVSNHGSLFLDEIAEIPQDIQPRLLRVLQERAFTRLGSNKVIRTDVRLISATHEALRRRVEQGRFRADLMYRVRVVPMFLPRLIERGDDIEVLTWRFIEEFNTRGGRRVDSVSEEVRDALFSYDWPGNIRELRNNIEYAFAIGEGSCIELEDLTPELRGERPLESRLNETSDSSNKEKEDIIKALSEAKGRKAKAAELLGLSRATLWRKMREYKLLG